MDRQTTSDAQGRLQAFAPWAGIAFAVLLVAGVLLVADTPDNTDKAAWVNFHDDSGNRWQQIAGGYMGIISAFAFLWFGHALVARLGRSDGRSGVLESLARAAATIFAVMLIAFMLLDIAVSASIQIGDAAAPDSADFGIQFEQVAFGALLVPGCMAAALFIATASELAREAAAFPRWLTWAGFVSAVLLLLGALFFPVVLIPLWALVTSAYLLMRPGEQSAPTLRGGVAGSPTPSRG